MAYGLEGLMRILIHAALILTDMADLIHDQGAGKRYVTMFSGLVGTKMPAESAVACFLG